ncbi:MAG TPA: OmpA family protein, partial [Bacteroidia bacterium]|nr:OmpA family protein [Bacteroidia bacterium]
MLKRCPVFILIFCTSVLNGQNLIVNPGLEHVDSSYRLPNPPIDTFDFHNIVGWYSPGYGESDYLNSDGKHAHCGSSVFNKEVKARTGNGYAGIFMENSKHREFVGVAFKEPLRAGQNYRLSMWLRVSAKSKFALNSLEVEFWDTSYVKLITDTNCYPPHHRQYRRITILKTNQSAMVNDWVQVSVDFTAIGGEKSLIVGHFADEWRSTSMPLTSKNKGNEFFYCYYFIDDLELVPVNGSSTTFLPPVIYFDPDLSTIKKEYYPSLDSIVANMKRNAHMTVQINGYTDSIGSVENNLAL